jgi:hypothetical protein
MQHHDDEFDVELDEFEDLEDWEEDGMEEVRPPGRGGIDTIGSSRFQPGNRTGGAGTEEGVLAAAMWFVARGGRL